MKNVEMKVEGNILTIKVDLTKEFGPSSSGKICPQSSRMSLPFATLLKRKLPPR